MLEDGCATRRAIGGVHGWRSSEGRVGAHLRGAVQTQDGDDKEADGYSQLVEYVKKNYQAVCLTVEPDSVTPPEGKNWRKTENTIYVSLAESVFFAYNACIVPFS